MRGSLWPSYAGHCCLDWSDSSSLLCWLRRSSRLPCENVPPGRLASLFAEVCEALPQKINPTLISDHSRVCLGNCCFFDLTHFSKDLVRSPRIPTTGKGTRAIVEHVMQCLGSATESAFGVFHQTPLLEVVPGRQLVVH